MTGGIENDHCMPAASTFCDYGRASENDQITGPYKGPFSLPSDQVKRGFLIIAPESFLRGFSFYPYILSTDAQNPCKLQKNRHKIERRKAAETIPLGEWATRPAR